MNVLVDTGSTTLAIASYARKDSNKYFRSENSTTIYNSGKEVGVHLNIDYLTIFLFEIKTGNGKLKRKLSI